MRLTGIHHQAHSASSLQCKIPFLLDSFPPYYSCLFSNYSVYTRHTSSCMCVGCVQSPESLT
ncbi:hypothetical protein EGD00_01380 [Pectobacterium carotovorum subsp. carotovorum]|nr:hypothetical protein EGD00_01380 [Pectobacterium carotovorum subsp. carotovorum]